MTPTDFNVNTKMGTKNWCQTETCFRKNFLLRQHWSPTKWSQNYGWCQSLVSKPKSYLQNISQGRDKNRNFLRRKQNNKLASVGVIPKSKNHQGKRKIPKALENKGLSVRFWLREKDSNLRPLGYEPNELPLLHPAIFNLDTLKDTIAFNGNSQGYEPDELPLLHPAICVP